MKRQVQSVLFAVLVATLLPINAPAAHARECSVGRPSTAHGHWSWRLIDGRKCWYVGKTMISKSLLRWPPKASMHAKAEPKAAPAPAAVATEKRSDPLEAQARLLEYANSFEARWRARAIAD